MELLVSTCNPASDEAHSTLDQSYPQDAPASCMWSLCLECVTIVVLVLLTNASAMQAESPDSASASAENIASARIVNPEPPKARIGALTNLLLGASAVTRALDGYSTARMLRNRCNGDLSVPVCNEEMFLPDPFTQSKATIYGYESGMWIAQVLAVQRISKHHQKLARLIPALDVATTLPFAVNNLRLPINSQAAAIRPQWNIAFPR